MTYIENTVNFRKSFPYPQIRDGQTKILNELAKNWDNYRIFVIDAPAGIGKSAISASVGGQFRSYLLTESKALQDQYVTEFPDLVSSLKGKSNYTCKKNSNFTVETSPCQINSVFVKNCRETIRCTYYAARDEAKESRIFLTNYNYFLTVGKNAGLKRPVVICDEGHSVSEKLSDFSKVSVNLDYLERNYEMECLENLTFPKDSNEAEVLIVIRTVYSKLSIVRNNLYNNLCDFLNVTLELEDDMTPDEAAEAFESVISRHKVKLEVIGKEANDIKKIINTINNQLLKIEFYLENLQDDWVLDVDDYQRKVTITPIDARRVFKSNILDNCDKVILMSASIGTLSGLCEELGLKTEEVCHIVCDSPFDPAKAPIHIMGDYDFSYKAMDGSLPNAMMLIDEILKSYGDEKGIIHAGNYKITNYILKNSRFKHRLIGKATDEHTSNEALFKIHAESKNPTVLISPSMHTGIDLKGDLSKFQIIVKFPFTSLADKRVKMKMELNSHWYSNETWKKIIQASGRSIRTEEDEATTFVLDRAFHYQYKLFKKHLPKWFKDRVVFANDE